MLLLLCGVITNYNAAAVTATVFDDEDVDNDEDVTAAFFFGVFFFVTALDCTGITCKC